VGRLCTLAVTDAAAGAPQGTTLLAVSPHVAVLSSAHLDSRCALCFKTADEAIDALPHTASGSSSPRLQRCSGCRTLHYCSAACQRADWPLHRQECAALVAYAASAASSAKGQTQRVASEPGTSVRALARLLWSGQKKGADWVSLAGPLLCAARGLTPTQMEPVHNMQSSALRCC